MASEQPDDGAAEVQAMLQDVDQQILTQGYQRAIVYAMTALSAAGFSIHFPNDLAPKLAVFSIGVIILAVHWLRAHLALQDIAHLAHDAGKAAAINAAPGVPLAQVDKITARDNAAIFAAKSAMTVVPGAAPLPKSTVTAFPADSSAQPPAKDQS